jgi:hypothetical protein
VGAGSDWPWLAKMAGELVAGGNPEGKVRGKGGCKL